MATFSTTAKPKYPEQPGHESPYLTARTWGGGFRTTDQGDGATGYQRMVVPYRGVTRTQWDAMVLFFGTTVNWSASVFTWTDPHGTTWTNLRYLGGIPEARSRNKDRWDVDLTFVVDPGV